MRILFVHQNFPGQFKHLAPALAAQGHQVLSLGMTEKPALPGVTALHHKAQRASTPGIHPWLSDLEAKVVRAEAAFHAARALLAKGFTPDVIVAHPGWGEAMFLKQVWPQAKLGLYCEFFYHFNQSDVDFDPGYQSQGPGDACRLQLKNANHLLVADQADACISPTHWQAGTYPARMRAQMSVIHDGIDTEAIRPNPAVTLTLNQALTLSREDEVITFVNRNLEPYRGYHVFMRALPELLRQRPQARVVIVGGDKVSYGAPPPAGQTWKEIFLSEVRNQLDLSRVHFVGHVPYPTFIGLLQLSTVHVYLTYPFVLSWSLLEAMSAGCAIVGSDTAPLHEAIRHNHTGRLAPFFDGETLVREVVDLLDHPEERARLGANARAFAQAHYDLKTVCLPQQLAWVERLANTPARA